MKRISMTWTNLVLISTLFFLLGSCEEQDGDDPTPIYTLALTTDFVVVELDEQYYLYASITDEDGNFPYNWESSISYTIEDTSILAIEQSNVVRGKSEGETRLFASSTLKANTDTVTILVVNPFESIRIPFETMNMNYGSSVTMSVVMIDQLGALLL